MNNSTGLEQTNIRHIKHLQTLGLVYLTQLYILALNTNIIPHMRKLANIHSKTKQKQILSENNYQHHIHCST